MQSRKSFLVLFYKKERLAFVFLGVIVFYAIGFLHAENGSGGAESDFARFHWPSVQVFTTMPWRVAVRDYPSATNPLAYMVASLVPWSQFGLRLANTVLGVATAGMLALACRVRLGMNWGPAALAGCLILLSPAFRATAFWANTDTLALFLAVFAALLLCLAARFRRPSLALQVCLTIIVAGVAAGAFYTRQFYAFVPVAAAWALWRQLGFSPIVVGAVFALAALPELGLVSLWHGFNPPDFHGQARPGWSNVLLLGSNLAVFAAPLLAGAALPGRGLLPAWWTRRATLAAAACLILLIVVMRGAVWPDAGGGLLAKAGLHMGWFATPFIVCCGVAGLSTALLTARQSSANAVLATAFLPPFLIAYPVYERYFDPVVLVTVLLFADVPTARAIGTVRGLGVYFLFSVGLLAVSLWHFGA